MLSVLGLGLVITLLSGVGWRVVSRLRSDLLDVERHIGSLNEQYHRLRDDLGSTDAVAVSALDGLFGHECKPFGVAHTAPKRVARKAPAKKVPARKPVAKKAAAKKAAPKAPARPR